MRQKSADIPILWQRAPKQVVELVQFGPVEIGVCLIDAVQTACLLMERPGAFFLARTPPLTAIEGFFDPLVHFRSVVER